MSFFKNKFKIGSRFVSKDRQFIVAEISGNHCGKLNYAKKLIYYSKKIGVDAVKIQAYSPENLTLNANQKDFKIKSKNNFWNNKKNLFKLYQKAHTPINWLPTLFKYAKEIKLDLYASVFDLDTLKLLEKLNCPAYKIASPEINHQPLVDKISKLNKPVIFSTGLAKLNEIENVIKILKKNKCRKAIILKSNTDYPADLQDSHIRNISYLKKKFNILVGFSDHTISNYSSLAATALGSSMLEKHLKLDESKKGIDSFFSLSPQKFKKLIVEVRQTEKSLGNYKYLLPKKIFKNRHNLRSIYVSKNVKKGEVISKNNIKIIRPSYGLEPKYFNKIIGRKFKKKLILGSRVKLSEIY